MAIGRCRGVVVVVVVSEGCACEQVVDPNLPVPGQLAETDALIGEVGEVPVDGILGVVVVGQCK